MKTRLALFATFTALVVSAFGASPASTAADPENFRVSLNMTRGSCEGGTVPECRFDGSAVVPQLGHVSVTGLIAKGCNALYSCVWGFNATMTRSAGNGERTLSLAAGAQWSNDPDNNEQPPQELHWGTLENSDFVGQGTSTDDFAYQEEFTINLVGTLHKTKP